MDIAEWISNLVASAPTRDEGVKLALDAILEATDTESGTVHLLPLGEAVMQLAASKNIPPSSSKRYGSSRWGRGWAGSLSKKSSR